MTNADFQLVPGVDRRKSFRAKGKHSYEWIVYRPKAEEKSRPEVRVFKPIVGRNGEFKSKTIKAPTFTNYHKGTRGLFVSAVDIHTNLKRADAAWLLICWRKGIPATVGSDGVSAIFKIGIMECGPLWEKK